MNDTLLNIGIFLLCGIPALWLFATVWQLVFLDTPEQTTDAPATTPPPAKFTPRRVDLSGVENVEGTATTAAASGRAEDMSVDGFQYERGQPSLNEAEGFQRDYYDPNKRGRNEK